MAGRRRIGHSGAMFPLPEPMRTALDAARAAAETSEGAQQVNTTSNNLVTVAHQQQALIRHFKV